MTQEQITPKKKRIKQISVTKLFGIFDHTIPLFLEDRVTIIYGPNGSGKTVILKMLKSLFEGKYDIFGSVPFESFVVQFSDETNLGIKQTEEIQKNKTAPVMLLTLFNEKGDKFVFNKKTKKDYERLQEEYANEYFSMLSRKEERIFKVESATNEEVKMYPSTIAEKIQFPSFQEYLNLHQPQKPTWLTDLDGTISVHFIETQRLLNVKFERSARKTSLTPTVQNCAKELAYMINEKLTEYGSLSQSLDRTFPKRVLQGANMPNKMDELTIRQQLSELEQKQVLLMDAGLLNQDEKSAFQFGDHINESQQATLAVYIEDTQRKLGVFDTLFEKIYLLTTIINGRFLYKRMSINKEQGFVFTTSQGTILPLESLSSGEQHELVLFFELLFKVAPGSLILIDEPELSLHIVWQQHFLEDIQKVTELVDIDVLIATHAPAIIDKRWDLTVGLKGPS